MQTGSRDSLSLQLARHCMRPVSDEALARAKLHMLDWCACAAAGAAQPDSTALYAGLSLPLPVPRTSEGLPGVITRPDADPWQKLLFRAAVGNRLEMDDVHKQALVHPGPVVIPAALFVAERLGSTPEALLAAIVRGYEAMICLGRAVGPAHYVYWHNTATCGPLGGAAAACSLLELDEWQWQDAFGHAITQSAGLWQVRLEPGQSKQWHNARAAQTGVQSACLASSGARGPTKILEGEKGFFAALCPDANPSAILPDTAQAAPAERHSQSRHFAQWEIFNTSFKPWPACRHAHATIDCALAIHTQLEQLKKASGNSPVVSDVAKVQVHTYGDAIAFCDKPHPETPDQARFSLQHCVSVALLFGAPEMHHFEPDLLEAQHIRALRDRIEVGSQAGFNASYPHHFGAQIHLTLTDGRVLTAHATDAWGDPESPMQDVDIISKTGKLLAAVGPNLPAEALIAACLSLGSADSIAEPSTFTTNHANLDEGQPATSPETASLSTPNRSTGKMQRLFSLLDDSFDAAVQRARTNG